MVAFPRILRISAALVLAAGLALAVGPPDPARAAGLPLGKAHYAVAVGGLSTSSTANWVRLGMYDFSTDGTVSERHYHWSQRTRVTRVNTDFLAAGCPTRDCVVKTAGGYQSTGAQQTLTGTYAVTGDRVRITWSGGQWEEFTLTSTDGGALADLELVGNNFGATYGFGAGSNAAWSARVPMSRIAAVYGPSFIHRYYLWKTTDSHTTPYIDHGDGNPFWVANWSVCNGGQCLGALTDGGGSSQYYVSPANSPTGHRRDTLWHWHTSLADNRGEYCYTGNSHVKPMLQIVDDNGAFHGWIGVEASLNQTVPSQGAYADDIGIFRIEDS